jgi:hypothetical protein
MQDSPWKRGYILHVRRPRGARRERLGDIMKPTVLALTGAILLAGCVSSKGSGAVHAISADGAARGRVTIVQLRNTPNTVSPTFRREFESTVLGELNKCTDGDYPLALTVTLNGYQSADAMLAFLAPAQSQISGVARLTDASGAVVGEYNIRRTLTVGGVIGLMVATEAEHHMSTAFGEELCKQAFKN